MGRHYDTKRWQRLRAAQIRREPYCRLCMLMGRLNTTDLEVDHIQPLKRGGSDHAGNLQTLCAKHHGEKTRAEARGKKWRPKGCDRFGNPLDLESDWYKPAVYRPYRGES